MPSTKIGPQSLLMETQWVCSWFLRLLNLCEDDEKENNEIYICDRSPFSAVCYANRGGKKSGHLLEEVIREHVREVKDAAGIEVYTVHVDVNKEVLWQRIQGRLKQFPERKLYNEHKRAHMDNITSFYDNFSWDCVVDNSKSDEGKSTAAGIMERMARLSPTYRHIATEKAMQRERSRSTRFERCTVKDENAQMGDNVEETDNGEDENSCVSTPSGKGRGSVAEIGTSPTSVLSAWQM